MYAIMVLMYALGALFMGTAALARRRAMDMVDRLRWFAGGMTVWMLVALFRATGLFP